MVIETDMQAVQASGHWPHITSEHLEGGVGDFHLVVVLVVSVTVVALQGAQVHLMSSIINLSKALGNSKWVSSENNLVQYSSS